MIQKQGTGPQPDTDTAEGARHAADAYRGPALDLTAVSHRRALVEAESEVTS